MTPPIAQAVFPIGSLGVGPGATVMVAIVNVIAGARVIIVIVPAEWRIGAIVAAVSAIGIAAVAVATVRIAIAVTAVTAVVADTDAKAAVGAAIGIIAVSTAGECNAADQRQSGETKRGYTHVRTPVYAEIQRSAKRFAA
jgi:hypothetical protein